MALRLTVPAAQASALSTSGLPAETRPKQAKEWLATLPFTNLFDSTRAVCDSLAQLNRSRLTADDRLKLLELYQPTLQRLRAEIAEDYNKTPLPLPATSRQAVNLARELLIEEGYAYKLALLEKSGKVILFGARKQIAPIVEQALRTLADALTLSYQSYLPTPAGVWHELHELFRYAVQQEMFDDPDIAAQSIDRIYKQAVLMALTDPYRLPRRELPEVMRVARELAPLVELRIGALPGAQQLFVIHPDTDKPPRAVLQSAMELAEPTERATEWVVGTMPVVHRLSEAMKRDTIASASDVLHTVAHELLQRLILCWGAPPKRVYRRQPGQATVLTCSGIQRICRMMGNGAPTTETLADPISADDALQEWEVINQSAGGFKLRGLHPDPAAINVGEIIAVQYRGMPGTSIGVIRWAQTFDDSSLEFGVQMLAPRGESVSLERTIGSRGAQRALLLPEIAALQQPASLLTQPGNYDAHREFLLAQSTQVATIRAGELIEKSSCYELFRFVQH